MQLVSGLQAMDAAHRLIASCGLVALASYPSSLDPHHPLEILALATPQQALVIDVRRTPQAVQLWQADRVWAAYDAKALHHLLLQCWGVGPHRWACIKLTESLLAGGRQVACDPVSLGHRYQQALPDPTGGFAALAAHAQTLAVWVAKQAMRLKEEGLQTVSKLEAAAVAPIATMEHHGMPFDAAAWRKLTEHAERERAALRRELLPQFSAPDMPGRVSPDNLMEGCLNHDAQLLAYLRAQGYRVPDLRRRSLACLPKPWGPGLVRYRSLNKILSTYGLGFLNHVGEDGRVHATFEQMGASTGRMACHSPNLQAMLKNTGHRACFRSPPTRRLVMADYAACELRILADMSCDPVFLKAFQNDQDVHAQVASSIFQCPVSDTHNAHLRQVAKVVNFGLVYGMGAAGLARTLHVPVSQAQSLLERYFRTFPNIRHFLESTAQAALARGYAQTLTGRRLYLDCPANAGDPSQRAQALRIARNMPIQGTNADILKVALARLYRRLAPLQTVWLINCIHDEVVVECGVSEAHEVGDMVRQEMSAAGDGILRHIPLKVQAEVALSWS